MNSCINKYWFQLTLDSLCLFVIHVSDRTLKVSETYCGEAERIAPQITKKWLPDDVTWWEEKTLEVADQSFHID